MVIAIGLVMGLAGFALDGVGEPVGAAIRRREPELRLEPAMNTGPGILLALLGGFRGPVADALWLRLYSSWERQDIAGTRALVRLVTSVDPRPAYFWINGARMLAYDVAAWRMAGGSASLREDARRQIRHEQAGEALAYLDAARPIHDDSAAVWMERANIALNQLRDFEAAAHHYRRAWEAPGGPYHAARLHARALRLAGRPREALAWLVQLHPGLPCDDDAAAAAAVLDRIRELESELGVPAAEAYRPQEQ